MRWILTALVVAGFALASFTPQIASADLDRLKGQAKDAKDDADREKKDAKEDAKEDAKDAKEDAKRGKKDVKRDLKH
jgi:hypothetical protein